MICNYINLKEIRIKNNLTKAAAAEIAGVGFKTYWLWEEGRVQPESEKLKTLAAYYGVTIETFLTCEIIPGGKEIIEAIEKKKDIELIEILNLFEQKYDISSKKAAMVLGTKNDKYVRWKSTLRCVERESVIAFLTGKSVTGDYIRRIIAGLSRSLDYELDEVLHLLNISPSEYEDIIKRNNIEESGNILDAVVNVVKNSEEYFNLELLEEYRQNMKLSHKDLRNIIGLKGPYYSMLINGKRKRISPAIINKISDKLSIAPELLKISENDKKLRKWKQCR